jgi:hypothetical protein
MTIDDLHTCLIMEHDVLIYTLLYKQNQYQRDKNTQKISCGQIGVKPCFPPDPPEMTALTGTPVLIDNEEIQTKYRICFQ